jgi:hypothetical protein
LSIACTYCFQLLYCMRAVKLSQASPIEHSDDAITTFPALISICRDHVISMIKPTPAITQREAGDFVFNCALNT